MISLITSAAYVDDEIAAEFGHLPAAFLPVGHKRLYELQLQELKRLEGAQFLTVPDNYQVPEADMANLEAAKVIVIQVPQGLRLSESILYALEIIGDTNGAVRILHGDTLIYDLPHDTSDLLAVSTAPDTYQWGMLDDHPRDFRKRFPDKAAKLEGTEDVLTGYFMFSNGTELRRSLARARGDFLSAVKDYRGVHDMTLWRPKDWLDFGHLQTFYRSRCRVRIQRAFNELEISFRTVEKRSTDRAKINAEALWFEGLPPALRRYTPAYLGRGEQGDSYQLEYLPLPSLHELFVFGDVRSRTWAHILDGCFAFMQGCLDNGEQASPGNSSPDVIGQLTTQKTLERLETFEATAGLRPDQEWRFGGKRAPSLRRIAQLVAEHVNPREQRFLGVMHGDLCFTNIFYDFRTRQIRVIDPRGFIKAGQPTILGDVRYDMAKLCHSLVGGYDLILAGRAKWSGFDSFDMTLDFPRDATMGRLAAQLGEFNLHGTRLTDAEVLGITIHLFLSMLPLHADRPDRQEAFVANALRLFSTELERV